MPQDLFEIALEHHRAGRLTQAEAGYRAALANQPEHPDALHWLGVLLFQAGQADAAIPLLESATALRPNDSAFHHNLAQAYLSGGRKDEAISALERAVQADPTGIEPRVALSQARLSRGMSGDADAAVELLLHARAAAPKGDGFSELIAFALLAAGRFSESIEACKQGLLKRPEDALLFYYLALSSRGAGQMKETRKALNKALELDPAMGSAWCALAMLDAEAGNLSAAAGLFRRAIAANRDNQAAYEGLALVLRRAGKAYEAEAASTQATRLASARSGSPGKHAGQAASVAALEQHLTSTPNQAHAHFAMAALLNIFPPMQTPNKSVSGLFDRYAAKFDAHLVGTLEYDVPGKLVEALARFWGGNQLDVLDAGCGTGLCGPLLRRKAKTLVGVDLSSAMIEKAAERGIYDRLEVGDLLETLRKSPGAFDLLVCADVLIYLGEAAPFFDAAVRSLRPGGLLAFSVESCDGDRFELVPRSRRYRHSEPYLRRLGTIYGYETLYFQTTVIRKERDSNVNGLLVILRLSA